MMRRILFTITILLLIAAVGFTIDMWSLSGKKDDNRPKLTKEQLYARWNLWKNLRDDGYNVGDFSDFCDVLEDADKLHILHQNLSDDGYDMDDEGGVVVAIVLRGYSEGLCALGGSGYL